MLLCCVCFFLFYFVFPQNRIEKIEKIKNLDCFANLQ